MIGETISHYRITEKIGAGGMGVVYRAHDPRLDRDVAIKVLPEAFSQQTDRLRRFEREARAAGALNHPNILAIYDVGTHDGTPYIVSELLRGENLRDRIAAGDLTARKAIVLAAQVADGLAAAHARGIVHRDLKPENVFLTVDGHVKILDFGLAKLLDREPPVERGTDDKTVSMLTDAGTVVGTVSYMSPEQLHGARADHRSDIFSFGVMLYEMLSGRRPFQGESKAQIVASILRDEPAHFSDLSHPVPQVVERIARQCLEKRPEDRFESAHDLAIALRAVSDSEVSTPEQTLARTRRPWAGGALLGAASLAVVALVVWLAIGRFAAPALPEVKHLAVMPFEAVGEHPESHLLAAGLGITLTDGLELIEQQTRGSVWVAPASLGDAPDQVWRDFNVTIALTGSLRIDDDRLRLELRAIAPDTGKIIRSSEIDDRVSNLLSLRLEPVLRVADMLELDIRPETRAELDARTTDLQQAYLHYIRGLGFTAGEPGDVAVTSAIEEFRSAIEEDPGFESARVALAAAMLRAHELKEDAAWLADAEVQARSAVDIAPEKIEGHLVLSRVLWAAGRNDEAVAAGETATRVAPHSARAHLWLGDLYISNGRDSAAESSLQRAINCRPGDATGPEALGFFYYGNNRFDAAANQFRRMTELAPRNARGHFLLGALLYELERVDEAREEFERSLQEQPSAEAYSALGTLFFEESRFAEAADMMERSVEMSDEQDFVLIGNLAAAYYWGGDRELAEQLFHQAAEAGEEYVAERPDDAYMLATLAGYHAMLGQRERSVDLLEQAIALEPESADVMMCIGESYADLEEHELALDWLGRALQAGVAPSRIERNPSLRRLRQDGRFRQMLDGSGRRQ